MGHRCPACGTPLWRDRFLGGRVKCPRCGTEFRPTVPWKHFRGLALLLVLIILIFILILSDRQLWIFGLFLVGSIIFFWFLPRIVDLQEILPTDWPVAEGPSGEEEMQLRLKYRQDEEDREEEASRRLGDLLYFLAIVTLLLLLLVWIKTYW